MKTQKEMACVESLYKCGMKTQRGGLFCVLVTKCSVKTQKEMACVESL